MTGAPVTAQPALQTRSRTSGASRCPRPALNAPDGALKAAAAAYSSS